MQFCAGHVYFLSIFIVFFLIVKGRKFALEWHNLLPRVLSLLSSRKEEERGPWELGWTWQ